VVSELAELFAVFVVLYLFECLAWVPRRTVGFFALAGRWRARIAFRPNAGWSLAVVLGKPWPPLTPPWLAEPLPFAVDPRGITLTESDGRRLGWDQLAPIVALDSQVGSGEDLSCKLASRRGAAGLAEALEQVRGANPKQRETLLGRLLDARFDVAVADARRKQFAQGVRLLRWFSNALWLAVFGGLGVAVLSQNMLVLLAAAAMTLLLWPINGLLFARVLRRQTWLLRAHWPDLSKRLVAMLSPLSAVRATDVLARELLGDLEPLAVAATLLSPRELSAFARPLLVAVQPRDEDDLGWWRTALRVRIERVLAGRKLLAAELLAAPERESDRVVAYCPACLAQYETAPSNGGNCPNDTCHDIPLRAFTPRHPGAPGTQSEGAP
jgi:hypothetical protein